MAAGYPGTPSTEILETIAKHNDGGIHVEWSVNEKAAMEVGAGAAYGEEALRVATTIKLTRALWIIPVAVLTSFIFKSKGQRVSIPWFIFFFILAMVFNTYVLGTSATGIAIGNGINDLARKMLTVTLFFIGASLSRDVLRTVGLRPLVQGVLLWMVISLGTLGYIYWR